MLNAARLIPMERTVKPCMDMVILPNQFSGFCRVMDIGSRVFDCVNIPRSCIHSGVNLHPCWEIPPASSSFSGFRIQHPSMLSDLSYRTPALLCFPLLYYFLNIFARLTLISVSVAHYCPIFNAFVLRADDLTHSMIPSVTSGQQRCLQWLRKQSSFYQHWPPAKISCFSWTTYRWVYDPFHQLRQNRIGWRMR